MKNVREENHAVENLRLVPRQALRTVSKTVKLPDLSSCLFATDLKIAYLLVPQICEYFGGLFRLKGVWSTS